jgi:hypothetical protein
MKRFLSAASKRRRPSPARRPAFRFERLEVRQMMTADPFANLEPVSYLDEFAGDANEYAEVVDWQSSTPGAIETIDYDGLPLLHSNPHASKSLYLNFRGATIEDDMESQYGNLKGKVIHAFDFGGDRAVFDADEQEMIRQIFQIVAEDFAPFDINVTTAYPGPIATGVSQHVAIGDWDVHDTATGLGYRNSFNRDDVQVPALVISANVQRSMAVFSLREALGDDDYYPTVAEIDAERPNVLWDSIIAIGNGVSHEAGHAFGLQHDSAPDQEYDKGTADWSPIMGWTLETDRMTWSHPQVQPEWIDGFLQDQWESELTILTRSIGARPDEHGDVAWEARTMTAAGSGFRFEAAGIISTMDDLDVFSFNAPLSGWYEFDVAIPTHGNLDAAVDVYGPDVYVSQDDPGLGVQGSVWLEAGAEYFLRVRSHGVYGDLGHYTAVVTWDLPEIGPYPEMLDIPFIPELDLIDPNPDVWYDPDFVGPLPDAEPWTAGDLPPLVDALDGAFDDYGALDPIFDEPVNDDYEAIPPIEDYWNNGSLAASMISTSPTRARSFRRF